MSARWLRAIALGLALAVLMLWWSRQRGIGTLVSKQGHVERDRSAQIGAFRVAALGESFEVGDGLQTAEAAAAELALVDGPRIRVRASTLIRLRAADGRARIALQHGELTIHTAEDPVLFETAAGLVRIAPHSHARLRESERETYVAVVLGRAELEWTSATPRSLHSGESARTAREVDALQALAPTASEPTVEKAADAASAREAALAAIDEDEPAANAGARALSDPESAASARTVQPPDVSLPAATSLTVFDASPPIRLAFSSAAPCRAGGPSLEIEQGGRFQPSEAESHAFLVGSTRYRLRCGEHSLIVGKVRVVKDAGQRAITESAPSNVVDADGRAYTVLYQTLLPHLTVRWPSARADGQSLLIVEGASGSRSFAVSGAQIELASGTLGDGEHRLWFQADGGDARSRTTLLQIRFDNVTPLARLHGPSELAVAADGTATLSGVVVDHARVSLRGQRVLVDAAGRFEAIVRPLPGERGVALKVELPRRSVVYYVRRFRVPNAVP